MSRQQAATKKIPQNDELVLVSVRLRKTVDRALEIEAATLDIPKKDLIEQTLMERLHLVDESSAA